MSDAPLMPMATAVWLLDNTSLTFKQIADFCKLHEVEIQGIADGEVAKGIVGYNPIIAGQLTKDIVLYEFLKYWPLFITVLIGGQIGSFLNIKFLSNKILALLTSLLVIFVAMRMGIRIFI